MKTSKLCIILMIMVLLVLQVVPAFAYVDEPEITSKAAVLIDAKTKEVLYEHNKDELRTPASLTKMMTAMLVSEKLKMDTVITVPKEATGITGNNMKLKKGEKIAVNQLLDAMLVFSANDAAIALALQVSDSLEDFYKLMNEKAKEIGCKNTNFISPNGLTNNMQHHSTAYEMALIAREAMKDNTIRTIVKKTKCTIPATNKSEERKFKSTNRLLYDTKHKFKIDGDEYTIKYKYATGIKTGMMSSSGNCLAAGAIKDKTELISVVLGSGDDLTRFEESKEILMFGMDNYKTYQVAGPKEVVGKVKVKHGSKLRVKAYVAEGAYVTIPKDADESIVTSKVIMDKDIKAPVKAGTAVGVIKLSSGGDVVGTEKLIISESVKVGGPWTYIGISDRMMIIIVGVLLLIIIITIFKKRNRKKKRLKKEEALRKARERKAMEIAKDRAEKKRRDWPY
ncbi:MAG: D-alanyl-D-alanine carboxypeptidase family protein [Anaerovoracaceae bacterium]